MFQDTIFHLDLPKKVSIINPLPLEEFNLLKIQGTRLETTRFESGTIFGLPKRAGTNYFLSFIQGQAPTVFNSKKIGIHHVVGKR